MGRSDMGQSTCSVDGCVELTIARGYCPRHWKVWRKHGDPLVRLPPSREGSRKYTLNDSYFDEIDTQEKAYWLGFITADGGIIRSEKTFALRVELAEIDCAHVRSLGSALGSDKVPYSRAGLVGISLDSWRLVDSLGRLGITPRKSAVVKPWNGPADLMPHYWRGLFDGDGSIYRVSTRTDWCLNICGSNACVEAFSVWATRVCGGTAKPRQVRDTPCWTWAVTGGRKPQALAAALYGNARVALERKAALAGDLMAIDFDAVRRQANEQRATAMRAAWRDGTHPRSLARG